MNKQLDSLLFLGTGASMGIPVVGCKCSVCLSASPYNKRLRPSALITLKGKKILIDAGPDFRTQALNYGIDHLDGVIFTHAHHDHTAGIDDLRVYHMHTGGTLPCLASKATADDIRNRYQYIFATERKPGKLLSRIDFITLNEERGDVDFLGEKIHYFSFEQAEMPVNGFRFDSLGFVSDIRNYPETIYEDLKGVEKLILSALRFESSKLHFSIDEAIQFSKKVGAKETWLTHISHDVDYDSAKQNLPANVFFAYDGLSIKL